MSADNDRARTLLSDIDTLLKTQGTLLFARDNYNEQLAEAFGVALLDFMRLRGVELRAIVAAAIGDADSTPHDNAPPPGISYWAIQHPGKMPKLYGAHAIAELNWYPDEGAALVRLQEVERVEGERVKARCKEPGCQQTDGAPCAYPQCPQRSRQG